MFTKYVYFSYVQMHGSAYMCLCASNPYVFLSVCVGSIVYMFVHIQINHIQAKARFYFMTE